MSLKAESMDEEPILLCKHEVRHFLLASEAMDMQWNSMLQK